MNIISIIITAMLINNPITYSSLGINNHLQNRKAIIPFGIMAMVIFVLSSLILHFTNTIFNIHYLNAFLSIIIGIGIAYLSTYILNKYFSKIYNELDLNQDILTINGVIFGLSTILWVGKYDLVTVLIYSVSIGIGYILISYLFNSLINELGNDPIPKSFRGWSLYLIVLGIMSLVISRF